MLNNQNCLQIDFWLPFAMKY